MENQPITCPFCHGHYTISTQQPPSFCVLCGHALSSQEERADSYIVGGRYRILKSIAKGGMGEILLAYDTSCERQIALKRIRPDLIEHPQIQNRFLREAGITCQLTHPAIIPIYTIHRDPSTTYYTMPFVEGETLRQIIRRTRQQERNGEKLDHIGGSIPALMRIFTTICQAVGYAHSKGVIHRDLKLENIIVGKYGEVLLLDWGLAKWIQGEAEEELEEVPFIPSKPPKTTEVTRAGKIVGTIAYMAPEQALSHPTSVQTDIYSLGVILYHLLTLRPPFKRGKSIEEFRKTVAREEFIDPILVAPYRDIPHVLSRIAKKCLSVDPSQRYQSVDELIHDLEGYTEGRSEWFHVAQLDINEKGDWEFQENVLIAEHMAVTRVVEEAEWVSLMISHSSFTGNTKIETEVYIDEKGHGIGFLLSIPEAGERIHINDGYCLWLGSDLNRNTKLLRSSVEVMQASDVYLKRQQWYKVRIEKIEQSIHLYIDDVLQFSYIAHLPLIGTHIGLLARDADFILHPLRIYVGSLNIMVNCLAVPDAFLAHQDFNQALSEYRRIAYSFPDRPEGREAIFRSGLTLIEQAKKNPDKSKFLDQALQEFEKLHRTPGAPLEYLGKAIVYQTLGEENEEIKCFELAYRRYPKHPLLPILQEQLIARMHELSRHKRIAAYHFILLAVRHLPMHAIDAHTRRLFTSLQKHWEQLPFIEEELSKDKSLQPFHFATQLAFWLAKPYVLGEIFQDLVNHSTFSPVEMGNTLFCLIELGAWEYAQNQIHLARQEHPDIQPWSSLEFIISCHEKPLKQIFDSLTKMEGQDWRALHYFLNYALDHHQTSFVHQAATRLANQELSFDQHLLLNIQRVWAYLLEKNWQAAGEIFYAYPLEFLNKESTPLHFLYGCWLRATEGEEMSHIHFTGVLNVPYPRSWTLASHYLIGNLPPDGLWFNQAFLWEKRQLYRQLILYYDCASDEEKKKEFQRLYEQQFIHIEP